MTAWLQLLELADTVEKAAERERAQAAQRYAAALVDGDGTGGTQSAFHRGAMAAYEHVAMALAAFIHANAEDAGVYAAHIRHLDEQARARKPERIPVEEAP
jgi:hypothetical protein